MLYPQVVKELCLKSSRSNHIKVYNDDEADCGEEVLLSPDVMSDSNLKSVSFLSNTYHTALYVNMIPEKDAA